MIKLHLFTPEKRCLGGDMIAMYKLMNSDCRDGNRHFNLRSLTRTRGHNLKLEEKRFGLKLHRKLFMVRAAKDVDLPR